MGIKTKMALAGGFLGAVAIAAAAFGQTGSGPTSSSPTSGSTNPRTARRAGAAQHRATLCGMPDSRRAARVVHGEMKVKIPSGFAFLTIDQGEITSIDHAAKTITVKRPDGESVTASATDQTKVCKDGQPASFDSLKVGDRARMVQVRSDRFTGLRRIAAITPGSEPAQPGGSSSSSFNGDELGSLLGPAA